MQIATITAINPHVALIWVKPLEVMGFGYFPMLTMVGLLFRYGFESARADSAGCCCGGVRSRGEGNLKSGAGQESTEVFRLCHMPYAVPLCHTKIDNVIVRFTSRV